MLDLLVNHAVGQAQAQLDSTLKKDLYGRLIYAPGDPRAKIYGTPRKETIIRLAEQTPTRGCFVEFGVHSGGSAFRLAALARFQNRELHLFDTWNGIPESCKFDIIPVGALGNVDLAAVRKLMPHAIFHVGVFPHTMPQSLGPIAFAHIDCDQYRSCLAAIDRFVPLLIDNGVILFDDYNVTPGVKKAVDETFRSDIHLTREGKAYIKKNGRNLI